MKPSTNSFQKLYRPASRALSALAIASKILLAQGAGGTILGTVSDPSGAVIPNANVQITEVATGVVRIAATNSTGLYNAPSLSPGKYDIQVSAAGFAGQLLRGIDLAVGDERTVNLQLRIGSGSATVQVVDSTNEVQTASSTLTAEVSGTTIRELPLNGRDWTQLATLEPGVNSVRNQSGIGGVGSADVSRGARGFGNQLSVSGARPTQNNYLLDGISFNDYTNGAPGGVLGNLAGVDSIEQFSVLTTNYSAEYGRTSGGVITAITRSGTNQFHGDLYEFLRNSVLDARNFFDGFTVPPFKRNQFGGAVGGPIRRDKTFFFFNYEGLRQSLSTTVVDTVPSLNARNGILSTGTVAVDPSVAKYLPFWHTPNGPILQGGDTALYNVVTLQRGTENFYTARVDEHITDTDSFSGSFNFDQTQLNNPDPLNDEGFYNSNAMTFASITENHIFSPNLLNTFHAGFNRNRAFIATRPAINPAAADTSLGSIPGQPAPFIVVPGITNFLGGLDGFPNFNFGWNSFQEYDNVFWTKGAHSLEFGGAAERMQSNNLFHFFDDGRFVFGSLSDFLTNRPLAFSATIPSSATSRGIRETLFGGYVQDDWHVMPRLTINLGLRYEAVTVPTEVNGKLASLPSMTAAQVHLGSPYFSNPTLKNFEPRIGFAWDPSGHGKTAIRGGFGIFDVLPLPYEFLILSSASAPFSQNLSTSSLPPGSFPTEAYTILSKLASPTSLAGERVSYVDPHPSRSYVMQWNFNVQQELPSQTVVTLAYVGSRGVHLPFRTDDADIVLPQATPTGYLWPTPIGSGTVINPNVGRIDRLSFDADSYYEALELGAQKRMTHGVQFQASYTWGKSIDTGSSTIAGDQFSNSPSSLPFWFDSKLRRGLSDFNLGQNVVLSATWQLPRPHLGSGLANWTLGAWQLGGIFQASSGAPFTVLVGGDPLGLNNTDPYDYPDRVSSASCGSGVNPGNPNQYIKTECFAFPQTAKLGNAGRNPLIGPGLTNFDVSLFKNNPLKMFSESINLQFRAELFNVLNHTNFAPPLDNNTLFNPDGTRVSNAGLIDATQTASRQIQFGLKLIW